MRSFSIESLVAALERDLRLPRTTTTFIVNTAELLRVANVFMKACRESLGVKLRFDVRSLCAAWPQGRAESVDTWSCMA